MKQFSQALMNLTLVGGLAGLGACASITSLTTAKTLKEGTSEWAVAGTYGNQKLKMEAGDLSSDGAGVDVAWRYGITNDDEIGVRVAGTGSYYSGDYKRALVSGPDFGMSLGAGIGGTSYTVLDESATVIDFTVPTVYLDYYVSPDFTLFAAPKFIYRMQTNNNHAMMAVSGGVKWGQEMGLILEGGWAKPFFEGAGNGWQVAAGFFF